MKILCGLGNPEKEYDGTRHNVGFRFLDTFAALHEFPKFAAKGKSLVSEKTLEFVPHATAGQAGHKEKILLVKPQTFMNLSGEAVQEILQFYKLPLTDLLVIYDDVDLPLGVVRYRQKGSAGTHNGMRSIVETIASIDFPRLRIGIESRGAFEGSAPAQMDLTSFVLAPFLKAELPVLEEATAEAIKETEKWIFG
ncbi:MAG: aminoacyl-tRNA hydrolase [Candidatus Gracilibacteria bacterium]|jgi:PTH1 family peptidyl-tRNA hydrolase